MVYYCERCGKQHDGSFGSGRFCSVQCANKREHSKETLEKVSKSLKEYYVNLSKEDRICTTCGNIYHSTDNARKQCFSCLPKTIKYIKINKQPKTILDLSKRTISKVVARMCIPCTCCGFYIKDVVWDIHHIVPKKLGGTDDMTNLTYICPNCHRIAHTDINLLQNELISLDKYLKENNIDWEQYYYIK